MKKNELTKSRVCFDPAAHTYTLDGKMFEGVTPIVNWVFDKTYEGIPADVLARAAEYGTSVHRACQLFDDAGLVTDDHAPVIEAYTSLLDAAGLKPFCSEYLVSNEENIASSIDKVFEPTRNVYPLADIKTTSQYHVANVTLQLSIYAWLFEIQNPKKKAGKLFCVWLPKKQYGEPALFEVQRIPKDEILNIVNLYLDDKGKGTNDAAREYCRIIISRYCPISPTKVDGRLPMQFAEVEKEVARIETEVKRMEARGKELRAGLLAEMQKYGKDNWEGDFLILTRKKESIRTTLDSAKIKAEYPDVYAACTKESKVSESLTIKIK